MKKVRTKTTKKDFKKFIEYCEYWKEELDISDVHLLYEHNIDQEYRNKLATSLYSYGGSDAILCLNPRWDEEVNDDKLFDAAYEEMGHILTGPVAALMQARTYNKDTTASELHKLIHKIRSIIDKHR